MRKPVDGEVSVHYRQLYITSSPGDTPGLNDAFAGQTAGLCGAAAPGFLWLTTGLHTGDVGFTVEVHEHAPEVAPVWEDVVEVSFRPQTSRTVLELWGGEGAWDLDLAQTDYRVRYCAQGMDEGRALDTRMDGVPQADRYLLQFWPAPPEPDQVVRHGSQAAAYWHRFARELPPFPPADECAAAERQARAEQKRADDERRREVEAYEWGGRSPTDTLRAAPSALGLVRYDAGLVHALDAAGPGVQRKVAEFAARSAATAAGLTDLDWVAAALAALAQDHALPSPFDDWDHMWQALNADPDTPDRTVGEATPPPRPRPPSATGERITVIAPAAEPAEPRRISQPHMALPAVVHAGQPNALEAALSSVWDAVHTFGEDYPAFLQEVREFCSSLSEGAPAAEAPHDVPVPDQSPDESGVPPAPIVPEAVDGIDDLTVRVPPHLDMAAGGTVQAERAIEDA